MMPEENIFEKAIESTRILRMPKRNIATFGVTNINYYILSKLGIQTRIREGKVISERPRIIKPTQIEELFEGFGDYGEKYSNEIFEMFNKDAKILNYRFKNKPGMTSESASKIYEVYKKIKENLEKDENNLSAIIQADDDIWQISIMKFIVELTLKSAGGNIAELEEKGCFPDGKGVPQSIRNRIEYLFEAAKHDKIKRNDLGKLLTDYGLFKEYEDRFFLLYRN